MVNIKKECQGLWPDLPDGFKARQVMVDGVRLHVEVGGAGRKLVLLHGLGGSGQDFHLMAPLLARRFQCLLIDLPGFGRADKPDAPYTMDYFVKVLVSLWERLELGPCLVAGHSMGGLLALLLAARHPELVQEVAGICPGGGQVRPALRKTLMMKLLTTRTDDFRVVPGWAIRYGIATMYADPANPTCDTLCQRAISQWHGPERRAMARSFIRAARDILANPICGELDTVAAPVRLAAGARDSAVPMAEVKRLARSIPEGLVNRFTVLPAGHIPVYECPQATAQFIAEA